MSQPKGTRCEMPCSAAAPRRKHQFQPSSPGALLHQLWILPHRCPSSSLQTSARCQKGPHGGSRHRSTAKTDKRSPTRFCGNERLSSLPSCVLFDCPRPSHPLLLRYSPPSFCHLLLLSYTPFWLRSGRDFAGTSSQGKPYHLSVSQGA